MNSGRRSQVEWVSRESMPSIVPLPGITMWPLSGEKVMLNFVHLKPGAVIPEHHHPHEQIGTVLEGVLILTIAGETREVRYGDGYLIPGGTPHSAVVGSDDCLVIDVFAPPREDYLPSK
jgi:quercetin dioxygenase-like cupin family protein